MLSFTKIATLATLAFGVLASALPQPVASRETEALVARQSGSDLTTVLNNLDSALQAPLGQLNALTASDATADNVQPIVANIQNLLQTTVDDGKGQPLGSGNIIGLTATTLNNVLSAFGRVYDLPGVDQSSLLPVFQTTDSTLGDLVSTLLDPLGGLLGGLLTIVLGLVLGLVGGVVGIITQLNLTSLTSALGGL